MIIFKYEITRSEVYRRVRQCEKIKEISIEQSSTKNSVYSYCLNLNTETIPLSVVA